MTTIQMPSQIKATFYGYQKLASVYRQVKDAFAEEIVFDFSQTSFFDAHLAAVMGAILHKLDDNLNDIELVNFQSAVELILRKNDFLSHFGREKAPDTNRTTVQYRTYKPDEEKLFDSYVETQLLSNPELPHLSASLKRQIRRHILEVFTNAGLHGRCKRVFSCGQQFPRRNNRNELHFCIVDCGRTIRKNVREFLEQSDLLAEDAIEWAVQPGKTTKTQTTPGGLGLANLVEFLCHNKGSLQIVSSNGFWSLETNGQQTKRQMTSIFPGTIVNITFNLDDTNVYDVQNGGITEYELF